MASRRLLVCGALAAGAVAASAQQAGAVLVAEWRFEPGNFLADSSGNGHNLANNGATSVADSPGAFSGGSALFDGGDIMQTVAALDLSPYESISITWYQRVQSDDIGVLFEHSPNKNNNPGGFLADVNEVAPGVGFPSLRTPGGNNNDNMQHALPDANNPNGVWEQFTMTIDLTAPTASDILTVTNGTDSALQAADVVPFLNQTFFIGARGEGTSFGFVGNIDELRIDGTPIPEPAGLSLLALGGLGLLARRRR